MTTNIALEDRLVKSGEAATLLGVSHPTLYNWEEKGDLLPDDHTKGGQRLYLLSSLQKYLPENTDQDRSEADSASPDDLLPVHLTDTTLVRENYDENQTKPIKSQLKVLDFLISEYKKDQGLLLMMIGMLLLMTIKLLYLVKAPIHLIHLHFEIQTEYSEFRNSLANELISSSKDDEHRKHEEEKETKKNKGSSKSSQTWDKTKEKAMDHYFALSRASVNHELDDEEQNRAKNIISSTLEAYQRLTNLIARFEKGSLEFDVASLLLLKKPIDYSISVARWSVRTLSNVCTKILGTKSASKSQVGRLLKKLKWNCAIKPKLLSPDPNYGNKLRRIGHLFDNLKDADRVLYGDEFSYSTVKVAEYLKQKHAPEGLNKILPENQSKKYYRSKSSILINGLVDITTNQLCVDRLSHKSFPKYKKSLDKLLSNFLLNLEDDGIIYIILDNAPYHSPKRLRKYLKEKYSGKVQVYFLPTYSPNLNPIERVWQYLLRHSLRCGETEEELWVELMKAVESYNSKRDKKNLSITCEICHHKWEFNGVTDHKKSLDKHLCFNIPGLNPYSIYVLTHSVEHIESRVPLNYPTIVG